MTRTLVELVRVVVALVFATMALLQIVRMEWFDVLRWGPPSARLGTMCAAWTVSGGLIGWCIAAVLTCGHLWRQGAQGVSRRRHLR